MATAEIQLTVRRAAIDDAEAVQSMAAELATSSVVESAAFELSYAQALQDPAQLLAVAELGDEVVGYVHALAHRAFHANGDVVWVEEVFVETRARGRGVGRALIEAAEEWGVEIKARYVALATRRAADFYSALGFETSAAYYRMVLIP